MHEYRDVETRVLAVDPQYPQPDITCQAARIIQEGGLVAFPTETVYGLGADALNADAVMRIFSAKGRPAHDPVIVHIAGQNMLAGLVESIPQTARDLADKFWPGALTLVLPRSERVPAVVTANGPTVAVRCPDHPVAQALICASGTPIAAPSANRFSHTSPTTAQHVLDDLGGKVDLILDGGPTTIGVESTVLDLSASVPVLLRPGGVSLDALVAEIGAVEVRERRQSSDPLPSPGMLERHYAPRATLILYTGGDAVRRTMHADAQRLTASGNHVGLLLADEDVELTEIPACAVELVGSETDLTDVAFRLFGALRALDAAGVELILARDFVSDGLGLAIQDRLRRAAQQVISCD